MHAMCTGPVTDSFVASAMSLLLCNLSSPAHLQDRHADRGADAVHGRRAQHRAAPQVACHPVPRPPPPAAGGLPPATDLVSAPTFPEVTYPPDLRTQRFESRCVPTYNLQVAHNWTWDVFHEFVQDVKAGGTGKLPSIVTAPTLKLLVRTCLHLAVRDHCVNLPRRILPSEQHLT